MDVFIVVLGAFIGTLVSALPQVTKASERFTASVKKAALTYSDPDGRK